MKKAALIISILSLILTILPSFLVYFQQITPETNKNLMLAGTIGWFLTAPLWMNRKEKEEEPSAENAH